MAGKSRFNTRVFAAKYAYSRYMVKITFDAYMSWFFDFVHVCVHVCESSQPHASPAPPSSPPAMPRKNQNAKRNFPFRSLHC